MVTVINQVKSGTNIVAGRHKTTEEAAEFAINTVADLVGLRINNLRQMTDLGIYNGVHVHFFEETDTENGLALVG